MYARPSARNSWCLKDDWAGDHLDFRASLLGQTTTGTVDVADDHVRLEVQLPWMLSLLANKAKAMVQKQGKLMLEKPRPQPDLRLSGNLDDRGFGGAGLDHLRRPACPSRPAPPATRKTACRAKGRPRPRRRSGRSGAVRPRAGSSPSSRNAPRSASRGGSTTCAVARREVQ